MKRQKNVFVLLSCKSFHVVVVAAAVVAFLRKSDWIGLDWIGREERAMWKEARVRRKAVF
jgi:hypothetical protein